MIIKQATIYTEDDTFVGDLFIKEGKIAGIYPKRTPNNFVDSEQIDGKGLHLIPGFIDTHIHGTHGVDVMDGTIEALDKMAKSLVAEGTTSFLATTITQSREKIDKALRAAANYQMKDKRAELLGVHLEGPFLDLAKAGAQPVEFIIKPDLELFHHWQKLSKGKIKTITMAPEHDPNGVFIQALRKIGVNVSAGHTNMNFLETKAAIQHGVNQLTHLCNAMNGIHHRDLGPVGVAFLTEDIMAEIIADGIHLDQNMLELIYQNIGSERLLLITDSMRAKGLEPGEYDLGEQKVHVFQDRTVLSDGTLAGSILSMIDAATRMMRVPGVCLRDVMNMASVNPARQLQVFDRKGSIAIGKDADLLLVDQDLQLQYTFCRGEIAFQKR